MKNKLIALLIIFLLLISSKGFCQKNYFLIISGSVNVEKASAKDIKILIIKINEHNEDTIKVLYPTPTNRPTSGKYSIKLNLNQNYKIVFEGDKDYQETRYLEVSTVIDNNKVNRNYFISDIKTEIWITYELKKIGNIMYDKDKSEFIISKSE